MKPRLRMVEIVSIKQLGGRAFAAKKTDKGNTYWEEITDQEAARFRSSREPHSIEITLSSPVSPVQRIVEGGRFEYGSAMCYKGIGLDGQHEYWHIPTGTVMVEDETYALRQMADTLLILERWITARRMEVAAA